MSKSRKELKLHSRKSKRTNPDEAQERKRKVNRHVDVLIKEKKKGKKNKQLSSVANLW